MRLSPKKIKLNTYVKCKRVYPVIKTKKTLATLDTVELKLEPGEARLLALLILAGSQYWQEIEVKAERRTNIVTVSTGKPPLPRSKVHPPAR